MAHGSNLIGNEISRRNPQDEYELIQKIGSGTYGDVYKVIRKSNSIAGYWNGEIKKKKLKKRNVKSLKLSVNEKSKKV